MSKKIKAFIIICLCIICVGTGLSIHGFRERKTEALISDFIDNYNGIRSNLPSPADEYPPYMVKIHAFHEDENETFATGVVIGVEGDNKYILTNTHAIGNKNNCIMYDNMIFSSKIVYISDNFDLAVISIQTNNIYEPVELDYSVPEINSAVTSLGNIGGKGITISNGILWQVGKVNGEEKIISNASNSFGGSGGALLNGEGKLIGLNVSIHTEKDLSYAYPMYAIKDEINNYVGNFIP